LLVVLPRFFSLPLQTLMVLDIGLVVLLSGGLALIWGVVLRPVLLTISKAINGADDGTTARYRQP
jgi:hypothetical protein